MYNLVSAMQDYQYLCITSTGIYTDINIATDTGIILVLRCGSYCHVQRGLRNGSMDLLDRYMLPSTYTMTLHVFYYTYTS